MSFYLKLLIFGLVVAVTLLLLRCFPNSAISRVAFSWNGPVPNDKETLSHYMLRWALYAFKYGAIILIIMCAGVYVGQMIMPNISENSYFQVIFLFGLPLLLGMTILGGMSCLCKSAWYRLRKSNCKFCEENQEFTQNT